MNIISTISQALPMATQVIPAIAAGEMTLSGLVRAARGQIGFAKLSSELGGAALYGLASVTPIPYVAAVATAVFIGYSLLRGERDDAYISSKLIYKPCEFVLEKVIIPFSVHVIVPIIKNVVVPIARKVIQVVKFVWKHCRDTIISIVTKVGKVIMPILEKIYEYVVEPVTRFVGKIIKGIWNIGESLVQNILKPVAEAIWGVVRPILQFIGSALARLAFIPETFFNNPRWTAFAILAVVSVAVAL